MRGNVGTPAPHSLGSPERGAVAALCAVTEGLRVTWVRGRGPSHYTVGAGFHALPAWVDGLRRCARKKWCAGCAREIAYVGRRTRAVRTVVNAGAVGQAKRMRLSNPGNNPNTGRRGRRPLRAVAKRRLRRVGQRIRFPHVAPMVRGLCPRDCIRWAADEGERAVGNVGAIGHAGHPRQHCPGGHTTMVHRGRCTLQAGAYRTLRHTT